MPGARPAAEPMGIRFERGPELGRASRVDAWPALLVPLASSAVSLQLGDEPPMRVDRASIALVPSGTPYRVQPFGAATELLTLLVGPGARELACREYRGHVVMARLTGMLRTARLLPRTRWVDELAYRYHFERSICEKHRSAAAAFLETEITKELYFLCHERESDRTRASLLHEEDDLVSRARARIEADPFAPLRVRDLARHCHASESTLLRAFRRELGATPASYARERRLDAALLMLHSGRLAVGEVATRVGYSNVAAFTAAFGRRFGSPPSAVRHGSVELEVLPPHGAPPRRKRTKF